MTMAVIWAMILVAFAAWGQAVGFVTLHYEPLQPSGGAAAPLLDGSCGIFIGPSFHTSVASGAAEWFPQATITHEVGHCLGYDHPTEWKLTIMIPNVSTPTEEDLAGELTHEPWFQPFQYTLVAGSVARE